jgi:hypothetical protein
VPLQRPAAFAEKKVFTKQEFETRQIAIRNGLQMIRKLAPVEAIGLDWSEGRVLVEDLRTALITYPATGRLPALVQGVQRVPGLEDLLVALTDPKGPQFQQLGAFAANFGPAQKDSHKDFTLAERCITGPTVPLIPDIDDNYVQIIQSPDSVALVFDTGRRIIRIDTAQRTADSVQNWTGVSRGHWEGETLVVETRNFDGRAPSFAGAGGSREKVVVERFTRTSSNIITYAASVIDPKTFQDRIELSFPLVLDDAGIYESACHEGNYSLRNALSAARDREVDTKNK